MSLNLKSFNVARNGNIPLHCGTSTADSQQVQSCFCLLFPSLTTTHFAGELVVAIETQGRLS